MHTAFVLAAGFGTRLRPLTLHRPKPLVPVCGVPMLAYTLRLCAQHGLTRVLVNAHHLHEQLEAWQGSHEGVEVEIVVEQPDILGTGGALKAVVDRLAPRVAILNGDILHDIDMGTLVSRVPDGGGALALRAHPEDADRYGHVSAELDGTVVQMRDFAGTPPLGPVREDTHFTGIHALHRDLLDDAVEGFSDILRTAHKARIGDRVIQSLRHEGVWLDIGDPAAYLAANLAVLRGEITLALDPRPRAASCAESVWIGPGAEVHPDAVLEDAIIGAGARIGPVRVTRSVVWDGVTLDADLTDGIAHDGGVTRV